MILDDVFMNIVYHRRVAYVLALVACIEGEKGSCLRTRIGNVTWSFTQ